jgi:hypothetical protein
MPGAGERSVRANFVPPQQDGARFPQVRQRKKNGQRRWLALNGLGVRKGSVQKILARTLSLAGFSGPPRQTTALSRCR